MAPRSKTDEYEDSGDEGASVHLANMDSEKDAATTETFGAAHYGRVIAGPRCPHQGWCALGPTPFSTTTVHHQTCSSDGLSENPNHSVLHRGASYEPGFATQRPLIVEFPKLQSLLGSAPVRVEVVPCDNPFFALLVAKSSLAVCLRTTYGAENDYFVCPSGVVEMGKVAKVDAPRLRWTAIEEVLRIGRPDSATVLYHAH